MDTVVVLGTELSAIALVDGLADVLGLRSAYAGDMPGHIAFKHANKHVSFVSLVYHQQLDSKGVLSAFSTRGFSRG